MVWEAISNIRKGVSSDIQTPWSWLKKTRLRLVFSTTSRCLDIGWNTLPRVWYITSRRIHNYNKCVMDRTVYLYEIQLKHMWYRWGDHPASSHTNLWWRTILSSKKFQVAIKERLVIFNNWFFHYSMSCLAKSLSEIKHILLTIPLTTPSVVTKVTWFKVTLIFWHPACEFA